MVTRLTVTTTLVALFGVAVGFLAQTGSQHAGSAFASVAGGDCVYQTGVVCTIDRAPPQDATAKF